MVLALSDGATDKYPLSLCERLGRRAKTYYAAPPSRRGNSRLETLNTGNI